MRKLFKWIFLSILSTTIIVLVILVMWFAFLGPEQCYFLNPYIDTNMASNYSPEKFDQLEIGMKKSEVIDMIGTPLYSQIDTLDNLIIEIFYFTCDGKLLNQKMPWYMYNDYAWYLSSVTFDADNKVINIDKGWIYD
ncbi:MAG: hypothetical protein H6600_07045 [Flavobacteriales bacterium]|nr:hypothetical protein [Flavobacteriales bacterium]